MTETPNKTIWYTDAQRHEAKNDEITQTEEADE